MNIKKMLIIGDSLSYSRADYDPIPRFNSYDCFPEMGSWSFTLRDALIKSARGFVFGAELAASQASFSHTVFGDMAFNGLAGTQFVYQQVTDLVTLYLQKHPQGGAYRVTLDGECSVADVDFKGEEGDYHARAIFSVTLPADPTLSVHTVSFAGEGAFTLLGIACEEREVNISGRGSQTARFFLDHYDERVKKFAFDTVISVLGANDVKHTPLSVFEAENTQLIEQMLQQNKDARIIMILPPDMSDPDDPESNRACFCSKQIAAPYLDILRKIADKHRLQVVDTWQLFDNLPIPAWRFDDVHFNQFGNKLLFEKLWALINEERFV